MSALHAEPAHLLGGGIEDGHEGHWARILVVPHMVADVDEGLDQPHHGHLNGGMDCAKPHCSASVHDITRSLSEPS